MRDSIFFKFIPFLLIFTQSVQCAPPAGRKTNSGFFYGAGVFLKQEIYKGYDLRTIPLPVIGYQSSQWLLNPVYSNYSFQANQNISLNFRLALNMRGYDRKKSQIFQGMERRKMSIDWGVGATYQYEDLSITAQYIADALGYSKGQSVQLSMQRMFRIGPIFIQPKADLAYEDKNLVDYYYGVATDEATINRPYYQGRATINPSLGLSISTPILLGGMTRLAVSHTWYSKGITDSPLTAHRNSCYSVQLIFNRQF